MTQQEIKLAKANGKINKLYGQEVTKRIRSTYSSSDELAIIRKKLAGLDANNEFETYNEVVENIKAQVKQELEL